MLTLVTAPNAEPITVAEARSQLQLGTTAGEPAPTAPTVALAGAGAGNCDNGAHRVGVTIGTADGETEIGPLSDTVTVVDKTTDGKIAVSNITLGGSGATYRRLWLVPVAGGSALLAATIANNTATTATLSIADASLGVAAPTVNTTLDPDLIQLIATVRDRGELATGRAFLTQTWDYTLDVFPCDDFIELPKPPLQTITSVQYRDTSGAFQTWAASNYSLTNDTAVPPVKNPRQPRGRLARVFATPWPITRGQRGDVVIRFVAGYGTANDVPAQLKRAMLLDLAPLYSQNEDPQVAEIVKAIYWRYRSHETQRRAA